MAAECTSRWFAGLKCDHLYADCPSRRGAEADDSARAQIDPHGTDVCGLCLHRHNQREHKRAA